MSNAHPNSYATDAAAKEKMNRQAELINTINEQSAELAALRARNAELEAALEAMLPDFESGYIANHRKRAKHEARIRALLAKGQQ